VFNDGVRTGSSNVEALNIINGGPSRRCRAAPGGLNSGSPPRRTVFGGRWPVAAVAGFELADARASSRGVRFVSPSRAGPGSAATSP